MPNERKQRSPAAETGPAPDRAATISDVARLAGVSIASVSRVLNRRGAASPAVASRVMAAAMQLRYTPHAGAQALKLRRTLAVGAVVPTVAGAAFARCVETLQRCLAASGYVLLTASSGYNPNVELESVRALLGRGIDALILVGGYRHPQLIELLKSQRVPMIRMFTVARDGAWPSVGVDNFRAAFDLTNHLLDLGHVRFGVIAGIVRHNDRAAAQVSGIRDALASRGIALPPSFLLERPYEIAEGQAAMRLLLAQQPRVTAVMCGNDLLAFGAAAEAARAGFIVPEDLSITGFEDLDFAAYMTPPLTTVTVPVEEIAQRTAELTLAALRNLGPGDSHEVPYALVVRGSTGPAPAV